MNFVEELKNYLVNNGSSPSVGNPRWKTPSLCYIYVKVNENDPQFFRLEVTRNNGNYKIDRVNPIIRFNENYTPWDSTIKQTQTVFNSFPGIMGVANRTVNRSLI